MTSLKVVFDGQVTSEGVISERFQNVRAILWDSGNSNNNIFSIIGLSLTIFVPVIGTVLEREIALPLEDAINIGDEKYILWIPFELGDLPYEMELTIATNLPDVYARFYVLVSEASLESNSEKLNRIIEEITKTPTNNFSTTVGLIGTSLIPTFTNTQTLSPLLLTGF